MTPPPTARFALNALHCVSWAVGARPPSPPTLDSRMANFTSPAWSRVLTAVDCYAQQRPARLPIRKVSARLWPRTFCTRERGRFLMACPNKLSLRFVTTTMVDSPDQAKLPSRSLPLTGKRVVITRRREQSPELRGALVALGAEVVEIP